MRNATFAAHSTIRLNLDLCAQELYNTEPSARYDVMNYIKKDSKESNKVTSGDVIATLVIALVAFLIIFGIVKARKSSKAPKWHM